MAKGNKEQEQATPASTINVGIDSLVQLAQEISTYDTQIAQATGSDSAAKKALVDRVTSENADQVNASVDSLIQQLSDVDTAVLVGLVTRLEERLKTDLAPRIESFIKDELARTQTVSKDQVEGLKQARKDKLNQFKALREVLHSFGLDVSSVPEPKRSGGGRPPGSGGATKSTGANKENYRFLIDGKPSPRSQNKFSSMAFYATVGVPHALDSSRDATDRWGTSELRTFIQEQGVDYPNQDEWEVTLPNGKRVGARRLTAQDRIELGLDAEGSTNGEVVAEEQAVTA